MKSVTDVHVSLLLDLVLKSLVFQGNRFTIKSIISVVILCIAMLNGQ